MKVRIILNEEMLGMSPSSPDIYRDFIASKAPEAASREEEIEAIGVDEVEKKGITIFPKDDDGNPFMWDYQLKGFFKDACAMLSKAGKAGYPGGKNCAALKAYKKAVDGLMFIFPRRIKLNLNSEMNYCARPLRAQTAQGERISIAKSETVPAGTTLEFEVMCLDPKLEDVVRECLDYGEMRGLGQWRNSGKGIFSWEEM